MLKIFWIIVLSLFFVSTSNAQENTPYPVSSENTATSSLFSKNQKFDNEGVELYSTNLDLKSYKKLGVGLMSGTTAGLVGLHVEINVQPEEAMLVGLGAGSGYNTFNFGWKHNFSAQYFSAYTKVGYTKWFNDSSSNSSVSGNYVLQSVLSDSEIRSHKFGTNFLTGSLGLEYNQLEGELSGVNFFGEATALYELSKSILVPTMGVGVTYFY